MPECIDRNVFDLRQLARLSVLFLHAGKLDMSALREQRERSNRRRLTDASSRGSPRRVPTEARCAARSPSSRSRYAGFHPGTAPSEAGNTHPAEDRSRAGSLPRPSGRTGPQVSSAVGPAERREFLECRPYAVIAASPILTGRLEVFRFLLVRQNPFAAPLPRQQGYAGRHDPIVRPHSTARRRIRRNTCSARFYRRDFVSGLPPLLNEARDRFCRNRIEPRIRDGREADRGAPPGFGSRRGYVSQACPQSVTQRGE